MLQVCGKRNVREHRATNAAGIEDQAVARALNSRLAVAVTTQHDTRRWRARKARGQHVATRRHEAAVLERFFEQARRIVVGCAVAGQDPVVQPYLGGQAVKCAALLRGQCATRKQTCRRELFVWKLLNPAIMISAHRRQRQRLESLESFLATAGW